MNNFWSGFLYGWCCAMIGAFLALMALSKDASAAPLTELQAKSIYAGEGS